MSFEYNVITQQGANLIAQATASNPIVFVGCMSSTQAAVSKEDLASKTQSFYDGKTGSILAASATGNTARIIMGFANDNLQTAQIVKSACVLARLQSQTNSQAVIMAALSDSNSEIYIPDESSPLIHVAIPISVTINTDDDAATTGIDGASISDLDRFVSMHKAGNPSEGEAQTIKGNKTFTAPIKSDVSLPYEMMYRLTNENDKFAISPDRNQLSGSKSIGIYADMKDGQLYTNLSKIEESIFTDSNVNKKCGKLAFTVIDEDYSKSANLSIASGFYYNDPGETDGTAYSRIDASAGSINFSSTKDMSLKTEGGLLVGSKASRFYSASSLSDPFNNAYAEICTDYTTQTDVAQVYFHIKYSDQRDYIVLLRETDTQRAALYPYQSSIDLGKSTKKWDNVYANNFVGNATNDSNGNAITSYVKNVQSSSLWDTQIIVSKGDSTYNTIDLNSLSSLTLRGKADSAGPIYNMVGGIGFFFYKGSKTTGQPGEIIPGSDLAVGGFVRDSGGNITFQRFDNLTMDGSWSLLCGFTLTNTGDSTIVLAVKTSLSSPT